MATLFQIAKNFCPKHPEVIRQFKILEIVRYNLNVFFPFYVCFFLFCVSLYSLVTKGQKILKANPILHNSALKNVLSGEGFVHL